MASTTYQSVRYSFTNLSHPGTPEIWTDTNGKNINISGIFIPFRILWDGNNKSITELPSNFFTQCSLYVKRSDNSGITSTFSQLLDANSEYNIDGLFTSETSTIKSNGNVTFTNNNLNTIFNKFKTFVVSKSQSSSETAMITRVKGTNIGISNTPDDNLEEPIENFLFNSNGVDFANTIIIFNPDNVEEILITVPKIYNNLSNISLIMPSETGEQLLTVSHQQNTSYKDGTVSYNLVVDEVIDVAGFPFDNRNTGGGSLDSNGIPERYFENRDNRSFMAIVKNGLTNQLIFSDDLKSNITYNINKANIKIEGASDLLLNADEYPMKFSKCSSNTDNYENLYLLTNKNVIYSFGKNNYGKLGHGTTYTDSSGISSTPSLSLSNNKYSFKSVDMTNIYENSTSPTYNSFFKIKFLNSKTSIPSIYNAIAIDKTGDIYQWGEFRNTDDYSEQKYNQFIFNNTKQNDTDTLGMYSYLNSLNTSIIQSTPKKFGETEGGGAFTIIGKDSLGSAYTYTISGLKAIDVDSCISQYNTDRIAFLSTINELYTWGPNNTFQRFIEYTDFNETSRNGDYFYSKLSVGTKGIISLLVSDYLSGTSVINKPTVLRGNDNSIVDIFGNCLMNDASLPVAVNFSGLYDDENWNFIDFKTSNKSAYAIRKELTTITESCLFTSSNGLSWNDSNTSIPNSSIKDMFVYSDTVYIGFDGDGVWKNTTPSDSTIWYDISGNLTGGGLKVKSIYVDNGYILITTNNGIYKSITEGKSWYLSNSNITFYADLAYYLIKEFDNKLYVSTNHGILYSEDNGETWNSLSQYNSNTIGYEGFYVDGSNIYWGTNDGVLLSTNSGSTWSVSTQYNLRTKDILKFGSDIYSGTDNGMYIYSGGNWTAINNGLETSTTINRIYLNNSTTIFIATSTGVYWYNINIWDNTSIISNINVITKLSTDILFGRDLYSEPHYITTFYSKGFNIVNGLYGYLGVGDTSDYVNNTQVNWDEITFPTISGSSTYKEWHSIHISDNGKIIVAIFKSYDTITKNIRFHVCQFGNNIASPQLITFGFVDHIDVIDDIIVLEDNNTTDYSIIINSNGVHYVYGKNILGNSGTQSYFVIKPEFNVGEVKFLKTEIVKRYDGVLSLSLYQNYYDNKKCGINTYIINQYRGTASIPTSLPGTNYIKTLDYTKTLSQNISSEIVDIVTCSEYTMALDSNGDVWFWGKNSYFNVCTYGNAPTASSTKFFIPSGDDYITLPTKLDWTTTIGEGVVYITLGKSHGYIKTESGKWYGWGNNKYGQLFTDSNAYTLNDTTGIIYPDAYLRLKEYIPPHTFKKIVAGTKYSIGLIQASALTGAENLYLWGYTGFEFNIESTIYNTTINLTNGMKLLDWWNNNYNDYHAYNPSFYDIEISNDTTFAIGTESALDTMAHLYSWGTNAHQETFENSWPASSGGGLINPKIQSITVNNNINTNRWNLSIHGNYVWNEKYIYYIKEPDYYAKEPLSSLRNLFTINNYEIDYTNCSLFTSYGISMIVRRSPIASKLRAFAQRFVSNGIIGYYENIINNIELKKY